MSSIKTNTLFMHNNTKIVGDKENKAYDDDDVADVDVDTDDK